MISDLEMFRHSLTSLHDQLDALAAFKVRGLEVAVIEDVEAIISFYNRYQRISNMIESLFEDVELGQAFRDPNNE